MSCARSKDSEASLPWRREHFGFWISRVSGISPQVLTMLGILASFKVVKKNCRTTLKDSCMHI